MPPNPFSRWPARHALALALLTAWVSPAAAQPAAPGLRALVEAAWARQPEARALPARREAAEARRRAAAAWTPGPPALEAAHRSDRLTGNDGGRELEIGVAVPLWLPGERRQARALAQAEAAALDSGSAAARLRVAGAVREAWWLSRLAAVDAEGAQAQREATRRLAADVARRTQAGELSRADQHQAEAALAAAEATAAQAEAALAVALQQLQALAGPVGAVAPLKPEPEPEPEPEPLPAPAAPVAEHPALAEWQAHAMRAERAAALAATQSRAHPELALATTRERGATGERYGQTLTLALRLPFGGGPRHDGRMAEARAEATEAQARLALERERLQAEQAAAQARVAAARTRLAAAERRATLAGETRGFFDKSFRLGETDLPTRLRIEADAAEATREAARARIELAAAVSAWRQALGLLPP